MTQTPAARRPSSPGWRFRLGVAIFALGWLCPLFVPLVAATSLPTQWKTALSGALLVGAPEVLMLLAAGVMGKQGFEYIKARLLRFLRREVMPARVSRTRYRIGLVLFVLPLLFGWLVAYSPESVPFYVAHRTAVNVAGDLTLLASLVVLGGGFWDKLTALFLYDAKAQLPNPSGAPGI